MKLESTKTIDIERFVPGDEIDRVYCDNPYDLAPDGKLTQEALGVIRTAMEKSGKIALGRIVMATRERNLALEPRGQEGGDKKSDNVFGAISDAHAHPAMISIAEKIIEQQEGPFDPSQFVDRYEEAVRTLIEDKKQGDTPAHVDLPDDTNVIGLMSSVLCRRCAMIRCPGAAPGSAAREKPC